MKKAKTVLIVDDEITIRELLQEFIECIGYKTIICSSGELASEVIANADILITDFNMSGMNGADLAKRAKLEKPKMPVLIITGNPQDVPINHRANYVMKKPFRIHEIAEWLHSVK